MTVTKKVIKGNYIKKKSEYTKGVTRSRKSKNSEKYNGQTKRGNMTFNGLQNTRKLRIEQHEPQ